MKPSIPLSFSCVSASSPAASFSGQTASHPCQREVTSVRSYRHASALNGFITTKGRVHAHVCVCVCVWGGGVTFCTCICVCVCMCVCMHACMQFLCTCVRSHAAVKKGRYRSFLSASTSVLVLLLSSLSSQRNSTQRY